MRNLFFNILILLSNFIVPLLVIPIISKFYSSEILSLFLSSQYQLAFLVILADWGFSVSGLKELGPRKSRLGRILILKKIVVFRLFVLLVVLIPLSAYTLYSEHRYTSISCLPILLSSVGFAISPVFYLQFVENVKSYSISNTVCKVLFVVYVFLISFQSQSFEYITWGFFIFYIATPAYYFLNITNGTLKLSNFKQFFLLSLVIGRRNFLFFSSSLSSSIYRILPVVFAGTAGLSPASFNLYAVSDRVARAVTTLIQPLSQTMLPIILKRGYSKHIFYIFIAFGVSLTVSLLIFGDMIVGFLIGQTNSKEQFSSYIYILCCLPIIVSMSNFFGTQRLLVKSQYSSMYRVLWGGSGLSLLALIVAPSYILAPFVFIYISIFFEFLVLVGFVYECKRKNIRIF